MLVLFRLLPFHAKLSEKETNALESGHDLSMVHTQERRVCRGGDNDDDDDDDDHDSCYDTGGEIPMALITVTMTR